MKLEHLKFTTSGDIDFITEGLVGSFDDDVRIILFITTKNNQEIDDEKI